MSGQLRFLPSHLGWARGPSPRLLTHRQSVVATRAIIVKGPDGGTQSTLGRHHGGRRLLAPVTGPVGWVVSAIPLSPPPGARDVVGIVVLVFVIIVEDHERGESNGVLLEVSDSGQDRASPGDCGSGAIHAAQQRCRRLGAWLGKPATLPLGRARTLSHPPCRKGSWT